MKRFTFYPHRAFVALLLAGGLLLIGLTCNAQDLKPIQLKDPVKDGGYSIMKALSLRQSTKDTSLWSEKELSLQDLSNLLWAGFGINREDGKRTAASAMNAQDVDIYLLMKDGVYVYDAANNALNPVQSGDHRSDIGRGGGPPPSSGGGAGAGAPPSGQGAPGGMPSQGGMPPQGGTPEGARGTGGAPPGGQGAPGGAGGGPPSAGGGQSFNYPVKILLTSDISKFRMGTDELKSTWGIFDSGLVAQNIMLFCSGNGLASHPKAAVDTDGKIKNLLKLNDTQIVTIELDVGYLK